MDLILLLLILFLKLSEETLMISNQKTKLDLTHVEREDFRRNYIDHFIWPKVGQLLVCISVVIISTFLIYF